ncbi:MAG: sigma-54-dependent Fis family transcriptional regulator [Calditrichaeota bacterium]|nr:MAG: sigma-54-dependent Fis family transcriptional regulator [Calditrichota bacterium]
MYKILLVDDDRRIDSVVKHILNYHGFKVDYTASGRDAIDFVRENSYDAMLLDLNLLDISGVEVLQKISRIKPLLPVIVFSGETDIAMDAVRAVKLGAYDFLRKPLDGDTLLVSLKNAISQYQLQLEREELLRELQSQYSLVCESPAMKSLAAQIEKIAPKDVKVLILGETGVGKELIAGAIHHQSSRRSKRFVKVNCAAIPKDLLESELFGHKKGSFTGAVTDQVGKFIHADQGTLFLDEIAELTPSAQAKLLRVLETNEVEIIGNPQPQIVNVRIIAATNQDLAKLIQEKKFREDLYYRLNPFIIRVPTLRERLEDIPILSRLLLKECCEKYNIPVKDFEDNAMRLLMEYSWPGNVRQLRNIMEKLAITVDGAVIHYHHVYTALNLEKISNAPRETLPLREALERYEKSYILNVLLNSSTVIEAAQKLGIERTNLQKKMRKYGISMREINSRETT